MPAGLLYWKVSCVAQQVALVCAQPYLLVQQHWRCGALLPCMLHVRAELAVRSTTAALHLLRVHSSMQQRCPTPQVKHGPSIKCSVARLIATPVASKSEKLVTV
jgi:hypothetical protein